MGRHPTPITDDDAIFADYQAGMTQREVAVKHGISKSHAGVVLRRHPQWSERREVTYKPQTPSAERLALRKLRAVQTEEMFADYQSGMTQGEIAAKYRISQPYVQQLLVRHSEWGNRRPPTRKPQRPAADGFKECSGCNTVKPLADFHRDDDCSGGVATKCRDCARAIQKAWRDAHPEHQTYKRSWQARNKEARRASLREKYRAMKAQIFAAYGGRCASCWLDDLRLLHIDHVHENGAEERRRLTPHQMLSKIIREGFPATYQLLCPTCNTRKAIECGTIRSTKTINEAG